MSFAFIIPVYGQEHLTSSIANQLWEQGVHNKGGDHLFIVDNKGGWEQQGREVIIRPAENLRWTRGTNMGLRYACDDQYEAYVCMNNDVRISPGFVAGLKSYLWANPLVGLYGPLYDDVNDQQRRHYSGPAEGYSGTTDAWEATYIDGTCMVIPRHTLDTIGVLDDQLFGEYGWGADYDYSIRVRQAGGTVRVTGRSYLNHWHQGTAKHMDEDWSGKAGQEMEAGMVEKYGEDWRSLL